MYFSHVLCYRTSDLRGDSRLALLTKQPHFFSAVVQSVEMCIKWRLYALTHSLTRSRTYAHIRLVFFFSYVLSARLFLLLASSKRVYTHSSNFNAYSRHVSVRLLVIFYFSHFPLTIAATTICHVVPCYLAIRKYIGSGEVLR